MRNPLGSMDDAKPEASLNREVELTIDANCFVNPVFPKHGTIELGDRGMEFLADTGFGYIQIPWGSIEMVTCDIVGSYVRAIDVATDEAAPINFVITDGAEALRVINAHIGRDRMRPAHQNFKSLGQRIKDKFSRKGARADEGEDSGATTGEE